MKGVEMGEEIRLGNKIKCLVASIRRLIGGG